MSETSTETTEGTEVVEDITVEATEEAPEKDVEDVFPREVVEELRRENAKYRQRAKDADTLAQRLHIKLVRATGRLADPSDLPFEEAHLADPEALAAAVTELLDRKPHLASRRPAGDIGQGPHATASGNVSLADILRSRT